MKKLLLLSVLALTSVAQAAFPTYQDALQDGRKNAQAKNYAAARKSFEAAQALATTPQEKAESTLKVGNTFGSEGDNSKARAIWQQVVDDVTTPQEQKFEALVSIGGSYQSEGNNAKAREVMQQVVAAPEASVSL